MAYRGHSPLQLISDEYDRLTEHGKSDTVDTKKGVEDVQKKRKKASKSGSTPKQQDKSETSAKILDPPEVRYDSVLDRLVFEGDMVIDGAADPLDSLIGRGRVAIAPVIIIGVQEDGAIHLSDTTLLIEDELTGDVLMDAFLLEMVYRDSTLNGFTDMIQGYLDVPPAFAGGTSNTIGSSFLDDIQVAADAGLRTTFWMHTTAPLLGEFGEPVAADTAFIVAMKLGIAFVPTPTALWAGLVGLLAVVIVGMRRTSP